MERILNYIGGELVEPTSGSYLDDVDPATGQVYAQIPDSDERDVESAVEAAKRAFPAWSRMPANERCLVLCRIAGLIESKLDDLALAECVDNGKPLTLARSLDIPRAALNFRFFATSALHFRSDMHATDDVAINYTLRQPVGVAGIISPWNLPLYLFSWKVAPALACGNTVVAKPSEVTPMTAFLLAKICIEAELPLGVLNIVHGLGTKAGAALVAHPQVPAVSFTGGTVTGREITRVASPMFKKVSLEMGGKNPNIIFADADRDAAIEGSLRSSFANQGQVCLCGSRMYVEHTIYDDFLSRFVEETRKLRVGDPLEPDTNLGAVVSRPHQEKILGYLDLARKEGGTILCGGGAAPAPNNRCKNGFFVQPTVIVDLRPDCRVNREEIFGPVVTVTPFDSVDEVLNMANGTDYGLSASVWTSDVSKAHSVARDLAAGTVWINSWLLRDLRVPFGGMKNSGVGREGGENSIRFFTEPKNVCIRM